MSVLIVKLGATGDVVRTTTLLRTLAGEVTWITAAKNMSFLQGLETDVRSFSWEERERAADRTYDLVINLEDTDDVAEFVGSVRHEKVFGAFLEQSRPVRPASKIAQAVSAHSTLNPQLSTIPADADAQRCLRYTDDSRAWFDLSLISRFGREKADALKYQNRGTYQELLFRGLGLEFKGEKYLLPKATETGLRGDVAISSVAGPVWPMKAWAYYDELQRELEAREFTVNVLQTRPTLLEHLADVQGHRCLVSGDSLPMHLALGSGVKCVSIFTCTSPWEIFDYGLQAKLVSPLLGEFFYKRGFDPRATTAVSLDAVLGAVLSHLASTEDRR